MSRETILKGEVALFGIAIDDPRTLRREIDNATKEMESVRARIKEICTATPRDLFPEDTFFEMNNTLQDLFDEYDEVHGRLVKLYIMESNSDCFEKEE